MNDPCRNSELKCLFNIIFCIDHPTLPKRAGKVPNVVWADRKQGTIVSLVVGRSEVVYWIWLLEVQRRWVRGVGFTAYRYTKRIIYLIKLI
jgi:hypothetical protein